MKLTIELSTGLSIPLRRFATEFDQATLEDAAEAALREYLITTGYLELEHELDEDTETVGEA